LDVSLLEEQEEVVVVPVFLPCSGVEVAEQFQLLQLYAELAVEVGVLSGFYAARELSHLPLTGKSEGRLSFS
jgi:hypothetical protein